MTLNAPEVLFKNESNFPAIPVCDHYAGNEKFIRKGCELQDSLEIVFDITCDLEDGATAGKETEHAELLCGLIQELSSPKRRLGIRVHDPEHQSFEDDLKIALNEVGEKLCHLTIPKIRNLEQAKVALAAVSRFSQSAGLKQAPPIHFLIETHYAVAEAFQIAALPGVRGLDFGLMDFVSAHSGAIPEEAMFSPAQFDHPLVRRAKLALSSAALAHGVVPCHSVTTDVVDPEQAYRDAYRASREFGFLRMWSIHPAQIEPITRAMTPSFEEIQKGRKILEAAEAADWGPIRYEDRLHDRASYRFYWEMLKRAEASGVANTLT